MQTRTFTVGDTELDDVIIGLVDQAATYDSLTRLRHSTDAERDHFARRKLILASVVEQIKQPPTIERLGHFVPVEAWTEFAIGSNFTPGSGEVRWEVRSTTLGRTLETFETFAHAVAYRDHLIQNFDRQGA